MPVTITTYVNQVKRILHDINGNYWGTPDDPNEIIDYINQARRKTVEDTGCLRSLEIVTLNAETDNKPLSAISIGNSIQIYTVPLIWIVINNQRYPCGYVPFVDFNTKYRPNSARLGIPNFFSIYGQKVYFAPTPQESYTSEWDCVYLPADIGTQNEWIPYPFSDCVQYFAAHLAYFKDKAFDEAEALYVKYKREWQGKINSWNAVQRSIYTYGR